jgi:allophanate hydrolase subunit 1
VLEEVLALYAWLLEHPLPGQVDLVPASKTLLIRFESHYDAARVLARVAGIDPPARTANDQGMAP